MKKRKPHLVLSSFLSMTLVFPLFAPAASAASKLDGLKENRPLSSILKERSAKHRLEKVTTSLIPPIIGGPLPIAPVPTDPIQENDVFKMFSVSNSAISPDGDGRGDTAVITYENKMDRNFTTIYVFNLSNPASGLDEFGMLGDVYYSDEDGDGDGSDPAGIHTSVFNGQYFDYHPDIYEKRTLPDGLYAFRIESLKDDGGDDSANGVNLYPIFVKRTKPVINIESQHAATGAAYNLTGTVTDKFIDYKSLANQYGVPYDVNKYLKLSYVIKKKNGNIYDSNSVSLKDDGNFSIPLTNLEKDDYTVSLTAQDIAQNSTTKDQITLTVKLGWDLVDGKWSYYLPSGGKVTGWSKINGPWYYFNSNGEMQTGWIKLGDTWYYLTGSGAMKTGWLKWGSNWYFLAANGVMQTGWVYTGGKWYYLYPNGAMAYNTWIGKYRLGPDGAWRK
ncbi:hypothetical protein PH210_16420 [Paenibacillus sp. BSR1-1]|uniref:hypothetical protein n=1 Tax=Paenibacillus sp. BSR1-1 TaxID=3020845 RepID=UPI0025B2074C|nr:hypothetical protein [Paenibacillus sp. BSR1-1]MDN3017785.1 hypothetical protein [Paenibacillus sp. BSR1-1]